MSLTVVGSLAYDAVKTPFGERERMLGGAATHFALAASFFDEVRPVGPVGEDFDEASFATLRTRGTVTDDVEVVAGGKTFFWKGVYSSNLNERETLVTDLNVFESFSPKLSQASQDADVLFLANIQPDLQLDVRQQCTKARFVAMDSMNLWIDIANESLKKVIGTVDCLILNDEELEQLTEKPTLQQAAHEVLSLGPDGGRRQARQVRRRALHRRRLLRAARLPAGRGHRPDRRGRHASPAASSATSPRTRRSRSTTRCSAARWPTARRWPPTTSRSSAPSASSA